MRSKREQHEPVCVFAHDLINKLSNIIMCCDLLTEEMKQGNLQLRRVALIREIAQEAASELAEHQRKAIAESRKIG